MGKTLEELKKETFEYLTHKHNNQIRGFNDFDGYWKTKEEALNTLDDRKQYLKELYFYMGSITLEEIKRKFKESMTEYRQYLDCQDNRSSRYREYISDLSKATQISQKNLDILKRVKFFVGCCVGYFNEEEIKEMIENTKNSELNSTFFTHKDSQLSNAIFRLKILKSYLIDSPFVDLINKELKIVAKDRLKYHKIDINKLNIKGLSIDTVLELKELTNITG